MTLLRGTSWPSRCAGTLPVLWLHTLLCAYATRDREMAGHHLLPNVLTESCCAVLCCGAAHRLDQGFGHDPAA
jgi:hypothetical protein